MQRQKADRDMKVAGHSNGPTWQYKSLLSGLTHGDEKRLETFSERTDSSLLVA